MEKSSDDRAEVETRGITQRYFEGRGRKGKQDLANLNRERGPKRIDDPKISKGRKQIRIILIFLIFFPRSGWLYSELRI